MRVVTHNGLREPQSIEATRVVVYDNFGNPIALVVEHAGRFYLHGSQDKPAEFRQMLADLGIKIATVVTDMKSQPLESAIWVP